MEHVIHISVLEFEGQTATPVSHTCTYQAGEPPGHYWELLTISITTMPPASGQTHPLAFEFAQAKALASSAAHQPQAPGHIVKFGIVKAPYAPRGVMMFGTVNAVVSKYLGPCPPGWTLPKLGPPLCKSAPPWVAITVYSYGALKPSGAMAFVAVGLAAEAPGDEENVISLNNAILSGKLH